MSTLTCQRRCDSFLFVFPFLSSRIILTPRQQAFSSSKTAALFLCTLKADSSHPSHPSCPSISLTIQSTTSYDTANTSPDMTVCRRRPHPEDSRLFSPQILRLRQARHAFPTSPSPSRREDSTSRGTRSRPAEEHKSTAAHQSTSPRVHERKEILSKEQIRKRTSQRTDRRESQEMGTSAH